MTLSYKQFISTNIRQRVVDLRSRGVLTSKGECMSLAAIGRTLEPPVNRATVYLIVGGRSESRRIKQAIERELDRIYWIRKPNKGAAL